MKSKEPVELADMVSQGMTRIQQFVQQKPAAPQYQSESDKDNANTATTTDSKGPAPRRGRRKKRLKKTTQSPLPLPVHVAITIPPNSMKKYHIPQGPHPHK